MRGVQVEGSHGGRLWKDGENEGRLRAMATGRATIEKETKRSLCHNSIGLCGPAMVSPYQRGDTLCRRRVWGSTFGVSGQPNSIAAKMGIEMEMEVMNERLSDESVGERIPC